MRYLGTPLALLMLFSATVQAATCPEWVAKAVSIQGTVELRMSKVMPKVTSAKRWTEVKRGDTFCAKDVVRVKANSRAALILTNDTVLRLDQNSTISFSNLSANNASKLSLTKGVAHFISRVKQAFEVVTPFVNAAVEGTEFVVAANDTQSQVTVLEGKVRVSNKKGEVLLTKNQIAVAKKGKGPLLTVNVKPRDAVQWALYYPNIIDSRTRNSDAIIRAARKLSLGRVSDALRDLNKLSSDGSKQPEALALKAIIALVNNHKAKALRLASQAYENNKMNTSAMLAMSYVQQAHFNIRAALKPLIQQSNKQSNNSALVFARAAEVYLMLGELDKALANARQAVKLDAKLSKTQSVLGFVYLTQAKVAQAEQSFNKAIELDQSAPLPHLGLGLAQIRQGQLEQGRREIEYAASLDPNNALIRSYLGKAYYEEKRNKVATDQFDMAKDLDANDPTAWFYSAIQMQSNNRPVEALHDLQKSAELNDNRAVYRSRLLLDEDQAARSSGLARIYSDLGFNQLAQQQAFNSLNTDFTNYSAHRFLAESYANRSRHEIGRVSELLQSQLLASINIMPVAPHLSETELGIQPNAGPGGASFNEYDPLFARQQSRIQLSALAGTNNTVGDEVVYSQLLDSTALSVGQYHFSTDGFRANNNYRQDLLNFFVQSAITPTQSIQLEVKQSDKVNGDLRLRFDPTKFSTVYRETRYETSYRLGYNNKLSSTSNILASVINRDSMSTRFNKEAVPSSPLFSEEDRTDDSNSRTTELQYINIQKSYDYIVGIGNYHNVSNGSGTIKITNSSGTILSTVAIGDTNQSSTNSYFYSKWRPSDNLTLSLGASNEAIKDSVFKTNQVNPKLGLLWNISSQSQLRIASFRTLKRPLTVNQTIEPTLVSGFNQYLDDPFATDAKNYAFAFEHKFNKNIFSGVELTKRDLVVPIDDSGSVRYEGQTEYANRAYLYWTPSNILSVSAEFHYDDLEREILAKTSLNEPQKLITRKLPLSLKLHYPNGWLGSLTTTYYDQDVIQPLTVSSSRHDQDKFWIADARVGYRLAKRKGLISLEVRNLLDKNFKYYNATFRTGMAQPATIYHERSIWLRLAVMFD